MNTQWSVASCQPPYDADGGARHLSIARRKSSIVKAFSMVELLVTMTLLSLIVLALMAVFSSTQRAFRASVTQTGVLEGSRATVDLITSELRSMAACGGSSNIYSGVNFVAVNNSFAYSPLVQSLPASTVSRTNLLQYFFVLGRENTKWTSAGYIVNTASSSPLYPLYRYYAETNISANPYGLYGNFLNEINNGQWTNMSHVMDGVIHMVVRAYDPNGFWMTNGYGRQQTIFPQNVWFSPPVFGEVNFAFYSNTIPAAVELQLGVLEDRTLQRAESLAGTAQWQYLQAQSGHVHVFRQRITIPNADPSAYQ